MNNARRKLINDARELLQTAMDEEQEAFENLPESLQYTERGEAMETTVSELEEAIGTLEYMECMD